MAEIEIVLDAQATIGEAPIWSPSEAALYWIDVKAPALHRIQTLSGAQRSWPLEADIGGFALSSDRAGAIVALRSGIFQLDFASGARTLLAMPPFDPRFHRFNEGSCDGAGRFWIGVMLDPVGGAIPDDGPDRQASLHSFTLADGLRREPDRAELHNGMAWTPDGAHFFLSHSTTRTIYRYDVDGSGRLAQRRVFARVDARDGLPDGAALDTKGGYWCALHGAGRLRRFHPDGSVDRDIVLPVSKPTMCAFGGPDLDVLYVTSATDGLTPAQRHEEPHAGALLRLTPGETGVARVSTCG